MRISSWLTQKKIQDGIRIALILIIAVSLNYFWQPQIAIWTWLAGIFICYSRKRIALREAIGIGFLLLCMLTVVHLGADFLPSWVLSLSLILAFAVCYLVENAAFVLRLLLIVTLLIGLTTHFNIVPVRILLISAATGMIVGWIGIRLLYPVNVAKKFRHDMQHTLQQMIRLNQNLLALLLKPVEQRELLELALNNQLQLCESYYPNWIFASGINPALKAGYRYFIIQIEQILDLYSVLIMTYASINDMKLLEDFREYSKPVLETNIKLLEHLSQAMLQLQLSSPTSDYMDDIQNLENKINEKLPQSIELLDLSPDNAKLVALMQAIKDIRLKLLQLVVALPTE